MNCTQPGPASRLTATAAPRTLVSLAGLRTAPIQRSLISRALAGDPNTSNNTTSSTAGTTESSQASQPIRTQIIGSSFTNTRSRLEPEIETTPQHFGGAITTLLFGAVLLSERLNGIGIVQNLELHNKGFHPVLLGSIGLLLCAAAWPEKRERQGNPSMMVRIQMAGARIAYLGLAGAIAAEMFTGKGILTLLDVETGIEAVSDVEGVLAFAAMLFLTGPQESRRLK